MGVEWSRGRRINSVRSGVETVAGGAWKDSAERLDWAGRCGVAEVSLVPPCDGRGRKAETCGAFDGGALGVWIRADLAGVLFIPLIPQLHQ